MNDFTPWSLHGIPWWTAADRARTAELEQLDFELDMAEMRMIAEKIFGKDNP